MLKINNHITIPDNEIEFSAIRAQGAGGQNVNKVSSAIHLRFDIMTSTIPEIYQKRLLHLKDHRINKEGVVVIKAQQYRSQEKNKQVALERLRQLIQSVTVNKKRRIATKPTKSSQTKRLENKVRHSHLKRSRNKKIEYE